MVLATGTRLGPYEVISPLGAGGMGEVYRARDTRLARIVAVKILPCKMTSISAARSSHQTVNGLHTPRMNRGQIKSTCGRSQGLERSIRLSTAGGSQPRWRRDGKELFYISDGKLMAVEVKAGATFEPLAAKPLFDTHIKVIDWVTPVSRDNYAVSGDGQQFLINNFTEIGSRDYSGVELDC